MAEEKKPENQGPVVVRKGHVKPPLPGARIEPPQEEVLAPAPEKKERADPRPLWQRLADEKTGAAPKPAGGAPGPGPSRRGPPRGDRDRPRDRGDRRGP